MPAGRFWVDVTAESIGRTALVDQQGRDRRSRRQRPAGSDLRQRRRLLDARRARAQPGVPQDGEGLRFTEATSDVLGPTPDLARVIKARDLNGDGRTDIVVGTTYQTQSRLYLGTGGGRFREVTTTHLPRQPLSVGDLEPGDVDGDGDLDLVLADWGPGDNMSNDGGRTRLWLNDGAGAVHGCDRSPDARRPGALLVGPRARGRRQRRRPRSCSISCKRCGGSHLFRNDGAGTFADDPRGLPQYTNNYEFEPMDLDGDGFLDLVTINDGEIVGEQPHSAAASTCSGTTARAGFET